jgi:hypothetical protein
VGIGTLIISRFVLVMGAMMAMMATPLTVSRFWIILLKMNRTMASDLEPQWLRVEEEEWEKPEPDG